MTILPLAKIRKKTNFSKKMIKFDFFEIWTKMAKKCKPRGPRFRKFEIWTKVAKVIKPQGPFWLLTLLLIIYFAFCMNYNKL
ncbi:hypothetical protein Hanom_Chr03g00264261 [Helianthus anomalus]